MDVMAEEACGTYTDHVNPETENGTNTDPEKGRARSYFRVMKASELLARIQRRLKAVGLTESAACNLAKKPDLIRNIRKAVRAKESYDPRAGSIEALAPVLRTTAEWLINESGPEEVAPAETARLALQDAERQATKTRPAEVKSKMIREVDIRAGMGGGGVPVAEMQQIIGTSSYATDAIRGHWTFPDYFLSAMGLDPRHTDIVEAEGESMMPDLWPGDRCVVDRRRRSPSPDGIYAIWDGFGVVIKALQIIPNSDPVAVRIISKNPAYATHERTLDEVAIIGKVVNVIRRV